MDRPVLKPVRRQSLSDAVFDQLRDRIVSGAMRAGDPLPAERALCEALGVNRGAVRAIPTPQPMRDFASARTRSNSASSAALTPRQPSATRRANSR